MNSADRRMPSTMRCLQAKPKMGVDLRHPFGDNPCKKREKCGGRKGAMAAGVFIPTRQSCLDWSGKDMDLGHKSPSHGQVQCSQSHIYVWLPPLSHIFHVVEGFACAKTVAVVRSCISVVTCIHGFRLSVF